LAVNKARVLAAAQKHLSRNNVDRAIKELARIVKDDPKDLRTRQKIGELLARQGSIPDAMKELSVVAEAYERGGFYPKAAAIYKQMLRFEPDQMQWHLSLGEIYQQLAHLSDAMDHFNVVAEHYEQSGSIKERIDIYKKLLQIVPESIEYGEKLADIYHKEADPVAAMDVWAKMAKVLKQRGENESLLKVYEAMANLKPDDLPIARRLADLYLDRGDPRRALAKLQACFKADPQDTETLNLLADCFVDLGEPSKAVAVLKELARIYEDVGFDDYRNQVYDRISEIDPDGAAALEGGSELDELGSASVIADLTLDEGELSESIQRSLCEAEVLVEYDLVEHAQSRLQKAIGKSSGCFALHRALLPLYLEAEALDEAKATMNAMYEVAMDKANYPVAKAVLSRAVELDPEDEESNGKLEAFLEAMGDYVDELEPSALDAVDVEPLTGEDEGDGLADLASQLVESLGDDDALTVIDEDDDEEADAELVIDDGDVDDEMADLLIGAGADADAMADAVLGDVNEDDAADGDEGEDEDAADDFGDFDFDDEELQRIAAEMTQDVEPVDDPDEADEQPEEPADSDHEQASADDDSEPAAEAASLGDDLFGDLGDLGDLDDLDDLNDATLTSFQLGKSYFQSGAYDDAVIELRRAVEEGDQVSESLELLGLALRRTHDFKGSVKAFKDLIAQGSSDREQVVRVLFELGVTYETVGSKASAVKLYRKVVTQVPDFRDGEAQRRLDALEG